MIFVNISDQAKDVLNLVGLTTENVIAAVNDRHQGLVNPNVSRLVSLRWLSDDDAVLVDAEITGREVNAETKQVQIKEVNVLLALRLRRELPGGSIDSTTDLERLAIVVAESFGLPVTCHSDAKPVNLYTGPWDGEQIRIDPPPSGAEVALLATLNPDDRSAFAAWALNLTKYRQWWRSNSTKLGAAAPAGKETFLEEGWPSGRELKVTDYFRKECSENFGIRPRHAIEAATAPDQTTVLEQEGITVRIHSKLIPAGNAPYYLLVVEDERDGKTSLSYAFKVYAELCDGFGDLPPNDMLEALVERFGLPIEIGAERRRFFWATRVPVSGTGDIALAKGSAPLGRFFSQHMLLRIDEGPPKCAEISMAYCLDTDAYTSWLREHNR